MHAATTSSDNFFLILPVCVYVINVYVINVHAGTQGGQKRASVALELEVQGTEPRPSAETVSASNCWTISSVLLRVGFNLIRLKIKLSITALSPVLSKSQ